MVRSKRTLTTAGSELCLSESKIAPYRRAAPWIIKNSWPLLPYSRRLRSRAAGWTSFGNASAAEKGRRAASSVRLDEGVVVVAAACSIGIHARRIVLHLAGGGKDGGDPDSPDLVAVVAPPGSTPSQRVGATTAADPERPAIGRGLPPPAAPWPPTISARRALRAMQPPPADPEHHDRQQRIDLYFSQPDLCIYGVDLD
ncbi:unnamed protein product [Urochloa humidicola]